MNPPPNWLSCDIGGAQAPRKARAQGNTNKKTLSEIDICDKFIRPAIEAAGWDGMLQICREYPLRAGRVVVRGRKARREATTVLRAAI